MEINKLYQNLGPLRSLEVKNGETTKDGARIILEPFPCVVVPDFVQMYEEKSDLEALFEQLRTEIDGLELEEKNNDLYRLKQSVDLAEITQEQGSALLQLRQFLMDKVKPWASTLTGIELNDYVATTVSKYDTGDTLLCHDDELEERRVAFVLYLGDEKWTQEDGGQLELFLTDEVGVPSAVSCSVYPECNQLVLFEVSSTSFHRVAEVLTETKSRLSVNGWFHGAPLTRPKQPPAAAITKQPCNKDIQGDEFFAWINPLYLSEQLQKDIRDSFEEESQIELEQFLQPEKYNAVIKELMDSEWSTIGPANKRHYDTLKEALNNGEEGESVVSICRRLFTSEPMMLLLSQLTNLSLHQLYTSDGADTDAQGDKAACSSKAEGDKKEEAEEPPAKRRRDDEEKSETDGGSSQTTDGVNNGAVVSASGVVEWRRFAHGCYTLVDDDQADAVASLGHALDLQMFFFTTPQEHDDKKTDDWDTEAGGCTNYISKGEDEELLTVVPKRNSLALVYREPNVLSFVKHLNVKAGDQQFVSLTASYFE